MASRSAIFLKENSKSVRDLDRDSVSGDGRVPVLFQQRAELLLA
jgi:hypothetical protein